MIKALGNDVVVVRNRLYLNIAPVVGMFDSTINTTP